MHGSSEFCDAVERTRLARGDRAFEETQGASSTAAASVHVSAIERGESDRNVLERTHLDKSRAKPTRYFEVRDCERAVARPRRSRLPPSMNFVTTLRFCFSRK
jgi:hypothetical protein